MLIQRPTELSITYLLTYLPLFNKNIADLKPIYLNLLKRIHDDTLNKSLKSVCSYNEYYHLLIIASIHPAFSKEEQNDYENNAKSIQKKFQSINSSINSNNFSSHHDYNINDENDFDEGFSSHPSISNLNEKQSNNNNSDNILSSGTNITINNDVNTPNRHLMTKPQISNCLSAPPTFNNNNANSSDENDENSDEDDEDEEDDDDDEEEDDDDYNRDIVSGNLDINNNKNRNSSLLFGKNHPIKPPSSSV